MNKIEDLVKEIAPVKEERPKTYTAEVSHTDDEGIVWVRLPGAEQDTPTASTSSEVKMGDTVTVEWRNNKLYIAGNYTNPSAGVTRVSKVEQTAEKAMSDAETAQAAADSAQETANTAITIAGDTDQHFWFTETGTDTGAHITEATQEDFLADPTNGGGNLLARSNGIAVRDGLAELAAFAASGAQIGQTSGAHTSIGASGMQVYKDATTQLANIGYGSGNAESGSANAPYYSLGIRTAESMADVGNYSMAEGYETTASGFASHAEGKWCLARGKADHAEGWKTKASGNYSHAEGNETEATGATSHAEGSSTLASGGYSHAEGSSTLASGVYSHAEGNQTEASGSTSHAEGLNTVASGSNSHAQNKNTVAGYDAQTAIGKYNDNKQNNAFEIGNGSASTSSNAFEVDWDGNTTASGDITDGSGNVLSGMLPISNGIVAEDILFADNITINGQTYANGSKSVTKSGYTPIGIVGMHLQNATTGGAYNTTCAIHSFYLSGTTAYWIVRGTTTNTAKIKVTGTILYVKA